MMEDSVFRERIGRLRRKLAEAGCDTAWIIRPENRRYLSGFTAEDGQFTESSGSLLINRDQCLLVTDSRFTLSAEREATDYRVVTLKRGLVEGLPGILEDLGTRRLGFEADYLTWRLHRDLSEKLDEIRAPVELVPLNGVVEELRLVKEAAEIAALAAAADLMSGVLDEVMADISPGLTEKEIAWRIEALVREAGADGLAFPSIVASGPNSALPHAVPTDRKVTRGEPVLVDVGARLDGYCSDMTRTVFPGGPSPEFRKIYGVVRRAQLAALGEILPGVDSDHPDGVARKIISDAGYGDCFGHGLGHGVGLATHEGPRLSPLGATRLREGMVVTVEPGIYLPGKGGVRLEEMAVIEAHGPRILTRAGHLFDFT